MISTEKIESLNQRLDAIKDIQNVVTFPEIHVSEEQLEMIAEHLLGIPKDEMKGYYKAKIHGEILLKESPFVTREEQPDFQYLFDLGCKALMSGMEL